MTIINIPIEIPEKVKVLNPVLLVAKDLGYREKKDVGDEVVENDETPEEFCIKFTQDMWRSKFKEIMTRNAIETATKQATEQVEDFLKDL